MVTALVMILVGAPAAARCRATADLSRTGTHPVGFQIVTLVDTSRPTPANGSFPGAPSRTLVTQVWYPAAPGSSGVNAPVDVAGGPYPIVVHGHALFDNRVGELYLAQHLASHGYVVAAPDFPLSHIGAPGGTTVADLAGQPGDVRFVLAQVPGRLPGAVNRKRVGVSGLSLGALTTLLVTYDGALREPRIRAALPIAPPYGCALTRRFFRTTHVPLLLLYGDADHMAPPGENSERVFLRARGPRHLVAIHNGSHIGFVGLADNLVPTQHYDRFGCQILLDTLKGDFSLPALPDESRQGIAYSSAVCPDPCQTEFHDPSLDAARQHELTRIVATAFFDAYLKKDGAARCFLRTRLARENADVAVRTRR
jgi:predicted dienelactone hydrolase